MSCARTGIAAISRASGFIALVGAGLVPAVAGAVDGLRVRTPVQWSDVPCMTLVDRSVDPVVHLPYGIPFEDTDKTDDEVADGRTHQLLALCRDLDPARVLPAWLSEADVAAAEAKGLVDLGTVTGAAILDLDPEWEGCFVRIVADDERRPITFAAAAQGVDWDTSAVAAGAWVVEGFTHDPAFSIWSSRPGVVKVVDGPALDASAPAAAVLNGEEVVRSGEPVTIEGCVSAGPGAELSLEWAKLGDDAWQTAVVGEPVRGEGFAIELVLPPEMAGQAARVRVEAEDPQGRRTTAFMSRLVIVLAPPPGCEGDACGDSTGGDEGGGGVGSSGSSGSLDGTGGPSSGPDSTSGAMSSGADLDDDESEAGEGCGCRHRPMRGWGAGCSFVCLGLLGLCFRRSAPARAPATPACTTTSTGR